MAEAATKAANPGKEEPLGERTAEPGKAPTSDDIRAHLIARARAYAKLRGLKLGTVSDLCAGDGKFLAAVESGQGSFTVGRYQRAMDWFDANWPSEAAA